MKFFHNKSKKSVNSESFCAAPFVQLLMDPTGKIAPCCWNQSYHLGYINKHSFEEIWNGESMQKLREEFLTGKIKTCKKQINHLGCNRFFKHFHHQISLHKIQKRAPVRYDLRLNGRCNLSCIMCDVWNQPNGIYNETFFWKDGPTKIFPHLLEIDMLGGEPFIQADTYRLIDEVLKVNNDCTWAFVTNAHYRFNKCIKEYLDKIKIRWIQISIDSLNQKTYANIRVGGRLPLVLETTEEFLKYRNQRDHHLFSGHLAQYSAPYITLSMCVQKHNWHEIEHFYRFCIEKDAEPVYQFAYQPHEVSLLSCAEEEKRKVLAFFEKATLRIEWALLRPVIQPLKEVLTRQNEMIWKEPSITDIEVSVLY